MKKVFKIVLIILPIVLLAGCGNNSSKAVKTFKVELEANYTTGYTWSYTMDKEGIVEETNSQYFTSDASDITGAPGTQIYSFEGLKQGTVTITFVSKRSWENSEPLDTKKITLTVNKDLKIVEK